MRANPIINSDPVFVDVDSLGGFGFGNKYKGSNRVWTLDFEFELEGQHSLEMLLSDFELVPIIAQLTETAKFENPVFITVDSKSKNIVFEVVR